MTLASNWWVWGKKSSGGVDALTMEPDVVFSTSGAVVSFDVIIQSTESFNSGYSSVTIWGLNSAADIEGAWLNGRPASLVWSNTSGGLVGTFLTETIGAGETHWPLEIQPNASLADGDYSVVFVLQKSDGSYFPTVDGTLRVSPPG